MRRAIVFMALTALSAMFAARPAAAQGPPYPYEDHGEHCDASVQVDVHARIVDHEWTDEDGFYRSIENAPTAVAVLTYGAGESMTLPYNGSVFYREAPDGTWAAVVSGPFVWSSSPQSGFEEEGLWYSTGRVTYSGDHSDGSITFHRATGRFIDMCSLLAA